MASAHVWLELLALTKALFESTKAGVDVAEAIKKYRHDPATKAEAERVSAKFSTYTNIEIEALTRRMDSCRVRFIDEGSGQQRAACLCRVLNDAKDGNGGELPIIDDWQNIYRTLRCHEVAMRRIG